MSQSTIRTQIHTVVNAVADTGKVYDYQRFTNNVTDYLALFKTTINGIDQIRAWMVGYNGFDTITLGSAPEGVIRSHRFTVYGLLRLNDDDGSEKEFAILAEAVCDALDDDATLHAFTDDEPADIFAFAYLPFGDVLCHYAEINIQVSEQTSIG